MNVTKHSVKNVFEPFSIEIVITSEDDLSLLHDCFYIGYSNLSGRIQKDKGLSEIVSIVNEPYTKPRRRE